MVITEITQTKRGRFSLFVDGHFLFAVEKNTLQDCGIHVGQRVEQEDLDAIFAHTKGKETTNKAYTLLSQRAYPKKVLTQKLSRLGGMEIAKDTVSYMEELGLVDDTDYAQRYSLELYRRKYYSPKRIAYELRQKGISDQGIEEALSQFDPEENSEQAALFIQKKGFDLEEEKGRKRAYDNLLRLGYSYSEAKKAIGIVEEDMGE